MNLRAKQTTVRKPVEVKGVGLFTGRPVTVCLKPAPADTGIVFVRTDLAGSPRIPAGSGYLGSVERRTALKANEAEVHTVEHVLACATGLGIDNMIVEMSEGELPVGDGSALTFATPLSEAGLTTLDRYRRYFRLTTPVAVEDGRARIEVTPGAAPELTIHYTLDYEGPPLGRQQVSFRVTPEVFLKEIAPARTFCLETEAAAMQARGLGVGASYDNTLVIGANGPIGNAYRFADEPARHKVLDLMGDLALLGRSLLGDVRAARSGHALNARLVEALSRNMGDKDQQADLVKLDIRDIMQILPHRYPFLLVDRVIELEDGVRAVGIKNVSMNEHFFQGHFPGRPIMPGVLQIEAMAQLSCVLLRGRLQGTNQLAVLMGLDDVVFRRQVVPGDQLVLEAVAVRIKSRAGQVKCRATVDGQLAAEAVIKFMLVDFDEPVRSNGGAPAGSAAGKGD